MVTPSQDPFGKLIKMGGLDPLEKITGYLDTRSVAHFAQVNEAMHGIGSIWYSVSTRHHLNLAHSDPGLKKKVIAYLSTALPYTFVCVDQSEKTISIKKYIVRAYPETKLEEVVNAIYSQSLSPSETCEVTLTQFGQRAHAEIMEMELDPFDFTQIPPMLHSAMADGVVAFSWPALNSPKILADIDAATLDSPNPIAGPFAVFDTPKKMLDWTWDKFSPEKSFPGANKVELDSVIGLLREKTIVLQGRYFPVAEQEDPQQDPDYPGNFF